MGTTRPHDSPGTTGGSCQGIRVAIVDEYPAFARGVADALEEAGAEVVFTGSSVPQALEVIADRAPDVVLVEPWMRTGDGLGLISEATGRNPDINVIALSRLWDPDHVRVAAAAGARGHVRKDTALGDLPSVVRFVLSGAEIRPAADQAGARLALTSREREVIRLLATGLSNTEIAKELAVSDQTVKYHLHNAYRKLGVHNRVGAVHRASRLGLLAS